MLYELRKWLNLKSISVFAFIIILNLILFRQHIIHRDGYLLEDYDNYIKTLDELKNQDISGGYTSERERGIATSHALFHLESQVSHINFYPDYILGTPDRAEDAFALSGEEISEYAERNINKTVSDFEGLENLPLELGLDLQVTRSFDFKFSDLMLFAFIILVTTQLFTREYEEELFPLLVASPSRIKLAISKITAISLILLVASIGLYGGNIIMAGSIYGWDNWGRLVQSIIEFRSLVYPMTVGNYFVLAFLIKYLNALTFAMIIYALYTLLKKAIPVLLIVAVVWASFYLIYISVPVNSIFNIFHFVNPVHGFDSYNLIRRYQNVNLFNHPIEMLKLWPIICIVLLAISIGVIVFRFSRAKVLHSNRNWKLLSKLSDNYNKFADRINVHGGIFFTELRKSLLSGKALLVFLILFAILYNRVNTAYRYQDSDRLAYAYYVEVFGGKVSEDTVTAIETEKKQFAE